MKIKCFLALACIFTSSFKLLTAQELKKEQAFFYFMNVYNLNPSSSTFTYAMEINRCGRNYLDYYAIVFDNNNYIQKRNDEFERKSYSDKLNAKILDGINNVNFENKYTITSKAEIGEYSFSNNSFPIYFTMGLGALPLYYDNSCYLMVYVGEIVNYKYFNWYLNMPEIQAKSFIAKRKDPNGKINRKIYLKFTYSILNKQTSHANYTSNLLGSNLDIYVYSIDVLENEWSDQKLATLYPSIDFYDKVHGIKIKAGEEKIYFDNNWNILPNGLGAKYYRLINYTDGKISGKVKDYYISGNIQMEGTFSDYWANKIRNGLFIWYYENGQKESEINYINGLRNGKYTAWYSNGAKLEEVNYVNDQKNGCDYIWTESGDPKTEPGCTWYYFTVYKNGAKDTYNREYPFMSITDKEKNESLPKPFSGSATLNEGDTVIAWFDSYTGTKVIQGRVRYTSVDNPSFYIEETPMNLVGEYKQRWLSKPSGFYKITGNGKMNWYNENQ